MFSRNYDWSRGTWADFVGPSAGQDTRQTTEDPYVIEVYPDRGNASLYLCPYETALIVCRNASGIVGRYARVRQKHSTIWRTEQGTA